MMIVVSSVLVFLVVILFLVTIILFAEKKLVPQGDVKILINGDEEKSPMVKAGEPYFQYYLLKVFSFHLLAEAVEHVPCANVKYMKVEEIYCLRKRPILQDLKQKIIGD